jgi:hypothetical protein
MIKQQHDDDDDGFFIVNGKKVARDGTIVRVMPMTMMDEQSDELHRAVAAAAQQRRNEKFSAQVKGYQMSDNANHDADLKARVDRYEARDKRLSDAWKNPPAVVMPGQQQQDNKPAPTLTGDARQAAKDKQLENRWKDAR